MEPFKRRHRARVTLVSVALSASVAMLALWISATIAAELAPANHVPAAAQPLADVPVERVGEVAGQGHSGSGAGAAKGSPEVAVEDVSAGKA